MSIVCDDLFDKQINEYEISANSLQIEVIAFCLERNFLRILLCCDITINK